VGVIAVAEEGRGPFNAAGLVWEGLPSTPSRIDAGVYRVRDAEQTNRGVR
jgi:hypothetical protein